MNYQREVAKQLEPRQVKYKRVKIAMPHCPVCEEMLGGNNSGVLPYTCSCGVWESDWMNPHFYKIKIKAL